MKFENTKKEVKNLSSPKSSKADFEKNLVKEIKELNSQLQRAKKDKKAGAMVDRLTSGLKYAIRALCVYRGVLPSGKMKQPKYEASYKEKVEKLCKEIGIPYPLYKEEEKEGE